MTKHKIFKVFLFPYTSSMLENAVKISYTNFGLSLPWFMSELREIVQHFRQSQSLRSVAITNYQLCLSPATFLIPYFVMLALCGIPMMLTEFSLGQFLSLGPPSTFATICRLARGEI